VHHDASLSYDRNKYSALEHTYSGGEQRCFFTDLGLVDGRRVMEHNGTQIRPALLVLLVHSKRNRLKQSPTRHIQMPRAGVARRAIFLQLDWLARASNEDVDNR
jgi:hypothetical protein